MSMMPLRPNTYWVDVSSITARIATRSLAVEPCTTIVGILAKLWAPHALQQQMPLRHHAQTWSRHDDFASPR
ncbi:hypothetical protein GUJ93_ZPchr0006g43733 [Zizania palustris]|uniref:Uncharacterized protein n=1 Tax=Zizania palustris TaxID=103762 RepID=A0A8J5S7L6_ZIZPA|nr:hypothetical protein GUJ93_ZPchr0006g43733 [Zizania palustris]